MSLINRIKSGFSGIAFPNVCVCCGHENTKNQRQLCTFCLEDRFEDANPDNLLASSDTLLPAGVRFQHALWQFDQGGELQHLLHQLKYERLTPIGVDLGRKLGERVQDHPQLKDLVERYETVTLPVPLYYLKYRYRGFNQAFKIALGFKEVWETLPICDVDDVVRTKNTRTQTGFSLEKRLQNIQGAFKVRHKSAIQDKFVVIIDDVFTTGATTFEMAETLQEAGAASVGILTVAQA